MITVLCEEKKSSPGRRFLDLNILEHWGLPIYICIKINPPTVCFGCFCLLSPSCMLITPQTLNSRLTLSFSSTNTTLANSKCICPCFIVNHAQKQSRLLLRKHEALWVGSNSCEEAHSEIYCYSISERNHCSLWATFINLFQSDLTKSLIDYSCLFLHGDSLKHVLVIRVGVKCSEGLQIWLIIPCSLPVAVMADIGFWLWQTCRLKCLIKSYPCSWAILSLPGCESG